MTLHFYYNSNRIFKISLNLVSYKSKFRTFSYTNRNQNKIGKIAAASANTTETIDSKTFTAVYRYPLVRVGAAINLLKWPQILATTVILPSAGVLYFLDKIPSSSLIVTAYIGFALTTTIFGLGYSFNKTIGFIYLSQDGKTVKYSYLDFWGKRVDVERPIEDIMYFAEHPKSSTDFFYKTMYLYSTPEKFKLPLRGGEILDNDKFIKIFGSLQ